jgi:hypothetical protein
MADTGAPYFIPYAEPTDLVRDWPELSEDVALAIVAALENIPVLQKRVETFTGSGTWVVPSGVTYAIATITGGGSGAFGRSATSTATAGSNGGNSSVAFTGGTVTALGGLAQNNLGSGTISTSVTQVGQNAQANSGAAGTNPKATNENPNTAMNIESNSNAKMRDGVTIVAGAAVTPAESITVTVGAGGAGGGTATKGGDGGSGLVVIEYYEEA